LTNNMTDITGFEGDSSVHASAGTGKTTLLVEKFFRLLMREKDGKFNRMDRILAITFTEKAADEMRLRISRRIRMEIKQTEGMEPGGRKQALLAHLLDSRRRATQSYISTIHSFCARVLRENPVEAGIDPMFEIMDEQRSSALRSDALTKFLLAKLRGGAISDLTYCYGFSSDMGFETSVASIIEKLFPLMRAADMNEASLLAECRDVLALADDKAVSLLNAAFEIGKELSASAKNERGIEMIRKILDGLEKIRRLGPDEREKAVRTSEELVNTLKLTAFPKNESAQNLRGILGEMLAWRVTPLAIGSARELASLLMEFRSYYSRNVKKRVSLDFDDLQELTLSLLNRNDAIRTRYRELFHGVLVDEFQDVNRLQKEIIYSFAAPGDGKLFIVGDPKQAIYGFRGGDTQVFADVKEEIAKNSGGLFRITTNYRSSPELVNFTNRFFGEYGGGLFGEDDVCEANRPPAESPAVERLTFPPPGTADDNRFMEARVVAQRIKEMVDGTGGKQYRYNDIVLLFRKLTALSLYESVFQNADVPVMVYKGTGFFQSQEVADMASVLSLIDDPSDVVSWVATLRSPLVASSDETILAIRRGTDGKIRGPETVPDDNEMETLVSDGLEREKLADFFRWYGQIRNIKDRLTISETIESVIDKSGFMGVLSAQPNGIQKAANVTKLIELGRSMESSGAASLKNFVRRITALIDAEQSAEQAVAVTAGQNVVRIMTVHQAKGLEFPVVFLMDIDGSPGGPPLPVVFDQHRGMAVKYVDKETLRPHQGMEHRNISGMEARKRKEDAIRLFYVGVTRAKEMLVLSGCRMPRSSDGMAEKVDAFLLNHPALFLETAAPQPAIFATRSYATAYELLKGERNAPPKVEVDGAPPLLNMKRDAVAATGGFLSVGDLTTFTRCKREYLFKNIFRINPEPIKKGESSSSAEIGTMAHSILERIDLSAPEKEFEEAVKLESRERLAGAKPADRTTVEKCVMNILGLDLVKRLRDGELKTVGREIPFAYKFDGGFFMEGKIDLLLRDSDGTPYVADYKFSSKQPDAGTKMQAELYALAVSRFTGADTAVCALLYAKGKPRQYSWGVGAERLKEIDAYISRTTAEIIAFEKKVRDEKAASALVGGDEFKCVDSSCAFSGYCNLSNT